MLSLIFNGRCRLQRPRVLTGRKWFSDFVHLPLNVETPPCEHCGPCPCCYCKLIMDQTAYFLSSEDEEPVLVNLWLNKKEILRLWLKPRRMILFKQDGRTCQRNIQARSRKQRCCVKAKSITYSECVFVSSVTERAKGIYYIILSSVACFFLPIFPDIIS